MFAFPTTTTSYTAAVYGLERGGVSLGWLRCPRLRTLERLDGAGAIDVHYGVELRRQTRLEVMRIAFRPRPVDDADSALEHRLPQLAERLAGVVQRKEEAGQRDVVEQLLDAAGERRAHVHPLGRAAPVVGGSDRSLVSRKAHQQRLGAMALAHELPHVQLAFLAELGGPRIAQVRIVRPDGDAGEAVAALQEGRDRLQRLRHVPVAQVPGGDPGTEHRAVVHLSVAREPRVLLRREQVGLQRTGTAPLKLDELFHRL